MTEFFQRLRERKLVQWALTYIAAAFALIQVLDIVGQQFGWPEGLRRAITVALAIGFFVALVLAWYHGERGAQRVSGMELLILALLLAIGGALLWRLASSTAKQSAVVAVAAPAATSAIPGKSIAVLPFTDLSPTHDQEYFSDGMAEELLNALAKVKDLKVAARTASFHYKGRNDSLKTIGEELGVEHILEGSVRKQGDKVRITAQLIQTTDGFHQWSETYDGDMRDVFELQERIARAITQELKAILEGDQQQRLVPVSTRNAEAYALFLQATAIYNRRDDTHMDEAVSALEHALGLDPGFARAQARLAAVHVVYTDRAAPRLQLAEDSARKAIALDGKLAEPWAVLGRSYGEQRRFLEARDAYAHALQLEPDDALTNYWFGVALITTGYTREGRARLDRGLVLDPMQPNAELWRGLELSYAGDQEAAQRSVQHAADMGLSFAVYGLSEVAHARGDEAQALALMAPRYEIRMAECGVGAEDARRTLAGVLGGDATARADALSVIERCLARMPDATQFWAVKGLFYLDQPARLLAVAQTRLTNNETFLFEMLWSPYGKSARQLPAFAEFARKTGLAEVWDKYGPPDWCRRNAERDYVCQ